VNNVQLEAMVAEGLLARQPDGHFDLEPGWWVDSDGQWRRESTQEEKAEVRRIIARRFPGRQTIMRSELLAAFAEEGYELTDIGVWWPLDPARPWWA
jgi:hypothetical protein